MLAAGRDLTKLNGVESLGREAGHVDILIANLAASYRRLGASNALAAGAVYTATIIAVTAALPSIDNSRVSCGVAVEFPHRRARHECHARTTLLTPR